ncbi:adenylyl-sulfate kinase, partial [Candidatus Nitrosotalea sp. FS]|uniref:adenylyl-sulfate kinase n=1 Tax=Candidatus Nitrosotalea sp. FS TaxID=2341021 RepID=UPI001407445C
AGKTTIANLLQKELESKKVPVALLDGDTFRKDRCLDLGYSVKDRRENLRRAVSEAKSLSNDGKTVIVAFTSPFDDVREKLRKEMPTFLVHVKASLDTCIKRDPKGLYKKAQSGEITDFVPFDIPYEEPANPDLILDTEKHDLQQCVDSIISAMHMHEKTGNGTLPHEDKAYQIAARNKSIITTSMITMTALFLVLGIHHAYRGLYTVPIIFSFSEKFFIGTVLAIGSSIFIYNFSKMKRKSHEDKAYQIAARNKSIITTSMITMTALFLVLSIHYFYADIKISPSDIFSFSEKFFIGTVLAIGSSIFIYNFSKMKRKSHEDKAYQIAARNKSIITTSMITMTALFLVLGIHHAYRGLYTVPIIFSFSEKFFIGTVLAIGSSIFIYNFSKMKRKSHEDKAYQIAARNKSIITTSMITMTALFLVLSIHYFYADIKISPSDIFSFSEKFFIGTVLAIGSSIFIYNFSKMKRKSHEDKAYQIAARNKSIITTSMITMTALFLVLSIHYFYADVYTVSPSGVFSFSEKFFIGTVLAIGSSIFIYNFSKMKRKSQSSDDILGCMHQT